MRETRTEEPINLDRFENEFFQAAIRRLVLEYRAHFGDRLAAIYVRGSVHRGEAILGVSDLDLFYFITDAFSEADEQWLRQLRNALNRECLGGATRPRPVQQELLQGLQPEADEDARTRSRAWRFYIHYDTTRVWGADLLAGLPEPIPDPAWAQLSFQSPWDLTRHAAGLEAVNRTDFVLPDDLPLRLRKLARLAILGGAHLLMVLGEFRSFRGTDVIPPLERRSAEWRTFLEETRALYLQPRETSPEEVATYLSKLVAWMAWIKPQLEHAAGTDT